MHSNSKPQVTQDIKRLLVEREHGFRANDRKEAKRIQREINTNKLCQNRTKKME